MAYDLNISNYGVNSVYRQLGASKVAATFYLYAYLEGMSYIDRTATCHWVIKSSGYATNIQTFDSLKISINGITVYDTKEAVVVGEQHTTQVLVAEGTVALPYGADGEKLVVDAAITATQSGITYNFSSDYFASTYYPAVDANLYSAWSPTWSFKALQKEPFFITYAPAIGLDFSNPFSYVAYIYDSNVYPFRIIVPYVPADTPSMKFYYHGDPQNFWEFEIENPEVGYYDGVVSFTNAQKRLISEAIREYNEENNASAVYIRTFVRIAFSDVSGAYTTQSETTTGIRPSVTAPYITGNVIDVRPVTLALTGDENILIRYASHAKATITEVYGNAGKTVVETGITHNNETMLNVDTYTFESVANNQFKFHATDNRDETTIELVEPTMINYVIPSATIRGGVISGNGEMSLKIVGSCFTGSFGAETNEVFVYYRYKEQGAEDSEYTDWINLSDIKLNEGNNYSVSTTVTGLDYEKTYVFQAHIADILYTIYSADYIAVSKPIFDWSAFDFNFNVPVYVQGKKIGGDNTILWSGNDIMAANAVLELAEAVSAQTHGIVLIFSNASGDVSWNSAYIPKEMVNYYNGGGHTFLMAINAGLSTFGAKYLYISDTSISGHATNQESGVSASNIKFSNANYVLRYVIGV